MFCCRRSGAFSAFPIRQCVLNDPGLGGKAWKSHGSAARFDKSICQVRPGRSGINHNLLLRGDEEGQGDQDGDAYNNADIPIQIEPIPVDAPQPADGEWRAGQLG